MPQFKRILLTVIFFLLFGAGTTIAVSWLCAQFLSPVHWQTGAPVIDNELIVGIWIIDDAPALDVRALWSDVPGIERLAFEVRSEIPSGDQGKDGGGTVHSSEPQTALWSTYPSPILHRFNIAMDDISRDSEVHQWAQYAAEANRRVVVPFRVIEQSGWPWPALRAEIHRVDAIANWKTIGIPLKPRTVPRGSSGVPTFQRMHALPILPVWRFLFLDMLFWSVVWFVVVAIPLGFIRFIRRHARIASYRCAGCGYELRHITSDRCPECGNQIDRSDEMRRPILARASRLSTARVISCLGLGVLTTLMLAWGPIPFWKPADEPYEFAVEISGFDTEARMVRWLNPLATRILAIEWRNIEFPAFRTIAEDGRIPVRARLMISTIHEAVRSLTSEPDWERAQDLRANPYHELPGWVGLSEPVGPEGNERRRSTTALVTATGWPFRAMKSQEFLRHDPDRPSFSQKESGVELVLSREATSIEEKWPTGAEESMHRRIFPTCVIWSGFAGDAAFHSLIWYLLGSVLLLVVYRNSARAKSSDPGDTAAVG